MCDLRVLQDRQRGRVGGDAEFNPISSLWFATFALAPGFFLPLEQELGRALAHRKALHQGGQPVVGRVVRLAMPSCAVVLIAILALSPVITDAYFDGDWWMFAALVTAFVAYAPAHLARGICSGSGRFTSYAVVIGSDGIVRITLCVMLALLGVTHTAPYAFSVALSPLVAVVAVGLRGQLVTEPGPVGTLERGHAEPRVAARRHRVLGGAPQRRPGRRQAARRRRPARPRHQFAYGVLLARIPLFLFQAVQAALLPRLARTRRARRFRRVPLRPAPTVGAGRHHRRGRHGRSASCSGRSSTSSMAPT